MTPDVIGKLEQAFSLDCTVREACFYAGINPDTYAEFIKKDPKYSERFTELRNRPVLAARQKVVESLKSDTKNAQWYLERKRNKEFTTRSEIQQEVSGEIKVGEQDPQLSKDFAEFMKNRNEKA